MTVSGWAQIALFVAVLTACVVPLGRYLSWVFARPPGRLEARVLRPEPQDWKAYAQSAIIFSAVCMLALYTTLRTQAAHPFNPLDLHSGTWDVSFNTAVSFVSNTSWQFYAGETTLSYFSQMAGIALHSYLGAAVGLATGIAVIRGFAARPGELLGSFWLDLWRSLAYVLIPITFAASLLLVSQGVIQSLAPGLGPVASWAPIKTMGSVGGGFFNVNSAMPYENATPLSNFVQALLIVATPAALTYTFGRMVGNRRQGWALYGVMLSLFLVAVTVTYAAESRSTPAQAAAGVHGVNLEGKEQRFGAAGTALYAVATTTGASGAVNGAMESFSGLGGLVTTADMATGEVVFGGIGSGLSSMLLVVVLAVFIAGLMVGRTPQYLGKRIEAREVKLVVVGTIGVPLLVLGVSAIALAMHYGRASIFASGPQGLSETVYAYVSQGFNNGSAFAGYTGYVQPNPPGNQGAYGITFADVAGGFAMLAGRYLPMIAALAVAGSLASSRASPAGHGTLRTDTPTFATVVVGVIVLVALLTFIPAFMLGPGAQALTSRLF
jgi:K+-transporting ATPase ATPase A chain